VAAIVAFGVLAAHTGPGLAAARRAAAVAAPRVRFVPIAAFDSLRIPGFGAWSPRGQRLALADSTTRICVFDAARPERPPRMVLDARSWVRSFSWSPDGEWLLVITGDPRPDNQVVLMAVPVDGGTPDTLRAQSELWPAVWGPDGRIHYRSGRRRFTLEAPAGWVPSAGTRLHDPPVLEVADDLSLRFRHWSPAPGEEPLLPGADVTVGGVVRVRLIDMLPDGSRALVGVSRDTMARWRIVDADGATLTDLQRAGIAFQPTALSADGRLLAGFTGRWEGEAGWTRTELTIADANGGWVSAIEGTEDGVGPQLSRTGMLVAFLSRASGGTRVGRLVVTRR
jgi:hypothetical protein